MTLFCILGETIKALDHKPHVRPTYVPRFDLNWLVYINDISGELEAGPNCSNIYFEIFIHVL